MNRWTWVSAQSAGSIPPFASFKRELTNMVIDEQTVRIHLEGVEAAGL